MRLYIVVEGQSEEEFIKRVLVPHLRPRGVEATPIVVTTNRSPTGWKIGRAGDVGRTGSPT